MTSKRSVAASAGTAIVLAAVLAMIAPVRLNAEEGQANNHPAVGSWFGRAIQQCLSTDNPAVSCDGLGPAFGLYMTPTLTRDGNFVGNDSMSLAGPPFGPHTTAHGQWVPNGKTGFTADYVFMLPTALSDYITGLRFRWDANVIDDTTAVGFVNIYFQPALPLAWENLGPGQFPTFPSDAAGLVTSPTGFVRDPDDCPNVFSGCPLVFKFTIKRVRP